MNATAARPARRIRRSDLDAMRREGDGARRTFTRVNRATARRAAMREQLA